MKTSLTNIVFDLQARRDVECLVLKCGIHANLKGFSRLTDAVLLFSTGEFHSFNELYCTIAELRSLKHKTVIREISYAISQSPNIHIRLSELVGTVFSSDEIHNGLVIAALSTVHNAQKSEDERPEEDEEPEDMAS